MINKQILKLQQECEGNHLQQRMTSDFCVVIVLQYNAAGINCEVMEKQAKTDVNLLPKLYFVIEDFFLTQTKQPLYFVNIFFVLTKLHSVIRPSQ